MEDNDKKEVFSYSNLENQSYRYLQHLAKSMELPANFKKMYLIELILAKKHKSDDEVNNIILRVKTERLQLVSARKEWLRRKQTAVDKSSPPITVTPKRFTYSPEMRAVLTYNPKRSLLRNLGHKSSSDRVLRSFDLKNVKQNYNVINIADDSSPKEARIKIITNGGFPQINLTAKCVVKRPKPSILMSSSALKRQLTLTEASETLQPPAKRVRTLSGIYPIQETIPTNLTTDNVCLRKIDGSLTKINALIQKRGTVMPTQKNNYRNQDVNIQDIMNNLDTGIDPNVQIQYPNMSSMETLRNDNFNDQDLYSVYYHKKIRAEQIRCQRIREISDSQCLPNISDVFSQFNQINRKDLTVPLYVQVSSESERSMPYINQGQNYAYHMPRNSQNTVTLETLYNFKNHLTTNMPLLQTANTENTKCVYSTPIVATAMAQPSTIVTEVYTSDHRLEDMNEFLQFSESTLRRYSQDPSTPSSQCSQDVSTCSIPEMVEDAMDIIRRDGNYLQQIEKETIQCVLCNVEGSRSSIEAHVITDHSSEIHRGLSECSVSFRLSSLRGAWAGSVLQLGGALCVLRVRTHRDLLCATLASLSFEPVQRFGTITIYNKLTGEPFSWNGLIQPSSSNISYDDDENYIKISLAKLNLLHNSANIKFVNSELVSDSNNKVIVGQKLLNDINIDVYVKVFDC